METKARYLTPAEKLTILSEWHARRDDPIPDPGERGHNGGRGFADHVMHPWCDRINRLPGVCTMQSCSGHPPEPEGAIWHACLWLRFDAATSAAFDARAPELLTMPRVLNVDRYYGGSFAPSRETNGILFDSDNGGALDAAILPIVEFLESLATPEPTP